MCKSVTLLAFGRLEFAWAPFTSPKETMTEQKDDDRTWGQWQIMWGWGWGATIDHIYQGGGNDRPYMSGGGGGGGNDRPYISRGEGGDNRIRTSIIEQRDDERKRGR